MLQVAIAIRMIVVEAICTWLQLHYFISMGSNFLTLVVKVSWPTSFDVEVIIASGKKQWLVYDFDSKPFASISKPSAHPPPHSLAKRWQVVAPSLSHSGEMNQICKP